MQQLDERFQIDTPENVTFGYEVAGIGSRFIAALVDSTIILLLQILTTLMIYLVLAGMGGVNDLIQSGGLWQGAFSWVAAIIGLISFVLLWGYYIFFEMLWNGQSPGKMLAKLRVVRTDGSPISASDSVIRNLVRLVDFLPTAYVVGIISMFINAQSRRLGDLAAGTLVIREGTANVSLKDLDAAMGVQPVRPSHTIPVGSASSPSVESTPSRYPVERLTKNDIQLIESYITRKLTMSNRHAIASQLARAMQTRMHLPAEAIHTTDADAFLAFVLAEYRAKRQ